MEKTKFGQTFYKYEADALHDRCSCTDDSGSCEWCHVYYNGPTDEEQVEIDLGVASNQQFGVGA